MDNTHGGKAVWYDKGRPRYPAAFFQELYQRAGLAANDAVVADIGAGTGRVTQGFLEQGCKVFAVEPDADMLAYLRKNVAGYQRCVVLENHAERMDIPDGVVDIIFCGNAYHWFDRTRVVPELRRIVKDKEAAHGIVIAALAPARSVYTEAFLEIESRYRLAPRQKPADISPAFYDGVHGGKAYAISVMQDEESFAYGALSASYAPGAGDEGFAPYCEAIRKLFAAYSVSGEIETWFNLSYEMGKVNDLLV